MNKYTLYFKQFKPVTKTVANRVDMCLCLASSVKGK